MRFVQCFSEVLNNITEYEIDKEKEGNAEVNEIEGTPKKQEVEGCIR